MTMVAVDAVFRLRRVSQRSILAVISTGGAMLVVVHSWTSPLPGPFEQGPDTILFESFRHTPSLVVATAAAITALGAAVAASVRSSRD